jgi:ABC-type uncharacterized transport system ATPase subunit
MTSIIAECEEVSKLYGTFAALRKVSARLERGRCYLVLGGKRRGEVDAAAHAGRAAEAELREGAGVWD